MNWLGRLSRAVASGGGRVWRSLATQACFITFAMGGVAIGLIATPIFHFLLPDARRRQGAGKALVGLSFKAFVAMMRLLGVLKLKVSDPQRFRAGGLLLVANHPTLIDFVVLGSLVPRADCLVKSALKRDPARRWPVLLAGYIPNDEGEATLQKVVESLDQGNSVIIFPEGTRTPPGEEPKFSRGAAQVAVRTQRDPTPVAVCSLDSGLHKGGKWWLAPARPIHMELRLLEPIAVAPILAARGGEAALAARDLNARLEGMIREELSKDGTGS